MVEGECIHIGNLIPKTTLLSQKEALREISRGIVEGECIHIGNLIPKTALLSQKEALRESNFKRYGRRRMYTQRKFDSQNGHFRARKQLYENQISGGMVEGECIHRESLIPKTALLSQKEALRESNFKRIPKATELLKCFFPEPCSDACPTWQNNLKRNLRLPCARLGFKTGIAKAKKTSLNPTEPSMCIHSPSTIPLEI